MNSLTTDVDRLTDLPQVLFRLAERARSLKTFTLLAERTIQKHFEIFDWCERHQIETEFDFNNARIKISFSGDGPMLAEIWSILRQEGYNTGSRPKAGDTSYYGWWELSGSANLTLSFSSSVCRRVQTGTRTRTIEEPIFETVCGEQIQIPEDSPQPLGLASPPPNSRSEGESPCL